MKLNKILYFSLACGVMIAPTVPTDLAGEADPSVSRQEINALSEECNMIGPHQACYNFIEGIASDIELHRIILFKKELLIAGKRVALTFSNAIIKGDNYSNFWGQFNNFCTEHNQDLKPICIQLHQIYNSNNKNTNYYERQISGLFKTIFHGYEFTVGPITLKD